MRGLLNSPDSAFLREEVCMTNDEIDAAWAWAKEGRFDGYSSHLKPLILSDDDVEQRISVPNEDGSVRTEYSRRMGERDWSVGR